MKKKKICFIAQFPPPIHGLSKAVATLYSSELSQKYDFERIDLTNNRQIIKNIFSIGNSKADLFYFTISQTRGGNLRDLIILKLLELQHKRCFIHLHGGYYRTLVEKELPKWQKNINYNIIRRIEGVIVLGKSLKWIFSGMIPEEKIYVVPNCVDDEYLLTEQEFEEKSKLSESRQIRHVLYLSNFIRSKGYLEVLEMAAMERGRCEAGSRKRLHFNFAGNFFEDEEERFFWKYIKEHCLENYVTYHGIVDGYKKRELLKRCEIFILLTRYPKEGQPISILEAMGNGMAVVTTDHAGIPDIVIDGINGIVVKNEKEHSMSDIHKQILKLNSMDIGKRNRTEVLLKYSQSDYIRNMRKIFDLA